jgi:hypothetical protein
LPSKVLTVRLFAANLKFYEHSLSNRRLRQRRAGPALKNEMMLPAVLDPWAAHNCRATILYIWQRPVQTALT